MLYGIDTIIEGSGRIALFPYPNDESLGMKTEVGVKGLSLDDVIGWIIGGSATMDWAGLEIVVRISQHPFTCSMQGKKRLPVENFPLVFFQEEDIQVRVGCFRIRDKGVQRLRVGEGGEIKDAYYPHRVVAAPVHILFDD